MEKPPREHIIKDSFNSLRRERLKGGCSQADTALHSHGAPSAALGLWSCLCPALGGLSAGGHQELTAASETSYYSSHPFWACRSCAALPPSLADS